MDHRKIVVAHRGDRSRAHENTLEAFEHAIQSGCDMVEFDVRRTGDGELVVHHDPGIGGKRIADLEYSEVSRLSSALGYRVPRVQEVVNLTAGRIRLDIELKEIDCEDALIRLVFEHFSAEGFVITSFERQAIAAVRALSPGVRVGLLVYDVPGSRALEMFQETGADFLAPDCSILDRETLADANRSNVSLLPWTVNDPELARNLLRQSSVFGIITDRPLEMMGIRNAAVRTSS